MIIFSNVAGYRIKHQQQTAEKEIIDTFSIRATSKKIKCLEVNLTKEAKEGPL